MGYNEVEIRAIGDVVKCLIVCDRIQRDGSCGEYGNAMADYTKKVEFLNGLGVNTVPYHRVFLDVRDGMVGKAGKSLEAAV